MLTLKVGERFQFIRDGQSEVVEVESIEARVNVFNGGVLSVPVHFSWFVGKEKAVPVVMDALDLLQSLEDTKASVVTEQGERRC